MAAPLVILAAGETVGDLDALVLRKARLAGEEGRLIEPSDFLAVTK